MILSFLALVIAIIAIVQAAGAREDLKRLREELRALRAEVRSVPRPGGAARGDWAVSTGRPAPAPAAGAPAQPTRARASAGTPGPEASRRLTPEELSVLERFLGGRAAMAPEARERIAEQLATRFEGRVERGDLGFEAYLVAVHAAETGRSPAPPSRRAPGPEGADPERAGPERPVPERPRPREARPEPAAPRTEPKRPRALELETAVGSTWALRIGLAALAIAVALFARSVVPSLSPAVKVALAYAGAMALFGVGRFFESRLERFARPVMAGALAIGFFVSYASHFVPAMRALPLAPALVWMAAGVVAVLLLAERWGSEPTAGLAIFLGHVSAYVAGGVTEVYSLVVIVFLAAAAVVLLWRHDWVPLSLFALVASYGSHLLWAVADRGPEATGLGLAVNAAFLASYYGIFLAADLLAWRRRKIAADGRGGGALARALGPANLVLAVSLTTFLYLASDGPVQRLAWAFFGLAALQAGLAPLYRRLGNPDYRFYPALGAVLATLGFAAALDGLSLNLVLALEAVALLVAAHATRLRVFHLLAQGALAANFVHYWTVSWLAAPDLAAYIGGLAIAAAYLVQAVLEEGWYGRGAGEWTRVGDPGGTTGLIARAFDGVFGAVAPALAYLHAAAAAVLIGHQSLVYLGSPDALLAMGIGTGFLAAAALALASVPLVLSAATLQAGVAMVALAWRVEPALLLGLTAGGLVVACALALAAGPRGFEARRWQTTVGLAQLAAMVTLLLPLGRWSGEAAGAAWLMGWVAVLGLGAASIEVGRGALARSGQQLSRGLADMAREAAALTALLVAAGVLVVTERVVGGVTAPVWATGASAALLAAAYWRRQPAYTLAALAVLVVGDGYWLVLDGLGDDALASARIAAVLAGVPLAAGAVQDRLGSRRMTGADPRLGAVSTYVPYLLGSGVALAWCELNLPEAWSSVAFMVLPVALLAVSVGAAERRGAAVALLLAMVALLDQLAYAATTSATGVTDLLAPGLLLAAAGLVVERVVARGTVGAAGRTREAGRVVGLALLITATLLALVTTQASWWIGGPRTTIGWSLVGGALMAAGFAARSADYRRVALVVLGTAVVRVFAVDTRGLSDTAKTLAFFALGLSLVAVAWLYSRFGKRLREWL